MPIAASNIKIRQSQRLTDNPDGGGRMVQTEVVDGVLNNLFPNIGDEERTTGRTTLRKAFVHVDTEDTSALTDAIGIILYPPEDGNISMSMFSTGSYSDVRDDARDRVESYITKGAESRYVLLGNHFSGQQAISMYCMTDAPTPDVNDNLCLSTDESGYTSNEQYVRVSSVLSRTTDTFYDNEGAFDRDVIIFESVSALLYDFYGQDAMRNTSTKPPTRIYKTNTVEAASYYSVKYLTEAAEAGDLSLRVDTPYVHIVPSTTAETALTDQSASLGTIGYVQAGAANALSSNYSSSFSAGVAVTRYLGSPMVKGSVTVTVGSTTLTDDGNGNLTTPSTTTWGGTVDYAAGSVSVANSAGTGSTAISITATPAGAVSQQSYSRRKRIETGNQALTHVFSLTPLPAAGTVVFSYRALGKWITLYDNGLGQLSGESGEGSGTVNYSTGSVAVTCGAMPDLDSDMVLSYGTGVVVERRDGDTEIEAPSLHFFLAQENINPGSVSIEWLVSSATVTATDPDGDGVLKVSGTAVGNIVYSTGEVYIKPSTLPDAGSLLHCEYEISTGHTSEYTPTPDGGGIGALSLTDYPVRPGSILLTWMTTIRPVGTSDLGAPTQSMRIKAKDNGSGNIVGISAGGKSFTGTLGTINYTTGAISVQLGNHAITNVSFPNYAKTSGSGGVTDDYWRITGYTRGTGQTYFSTGTQVTAEWQEASAGTDPEEEDVDLPAVELDLTPTIIDQVVSGSVRFTFRGSVYVDRSGSLYRDISATTGAGTYAGTVDYDSGTANITSWSAGGTNAVTITALLTSLYETGIDALYSRTSGSPLNAGSFTLTGTTLDGDTVSGNADINGEVTGTLVEGSVDWETGSFDLRFGEMVTAAGNEGEEWYSAANVVGSEVWKPTLVVASSLTYNTVVYKSIPLSSVVVGLDPTRLPSDGKVPAFKSGQTVLVHHTQETSLTPTAGAVTDLGRTALSNCEVRDSDSVVIDAAWYAIDLDAGTVTWSDPLNLAGYTLPVKIRDRIDNRRLCSGVQVTGVIEINSALSRDFPEGSMISTCLRLGEANGSLNLQARVENLFDQQTWSTSSDWVDELVGNEAVGTFNDTNYPILVDNASCITERWAIVFTGSTAFEVRGETVGTVATGSTGVDCAPINARTGDPYFTIPKDGWGISWATGNALRFNTVGGLAPVWFARCVLSGTPETTEDGFRFEVIGNTEEAE